MSHYTRSHRPTRPIAARCVVYCRVSSAGQEDNSSLETQEERCRAYAAERGWTVTQVYREVHTGAELFERPQLTLLREAMRRREFDVLLVHALDRLSRKQTHQGLILSEAEHAGVAWDSVTEDIDDSPQGQILRAVIGGDGRDGAAQDRRAHGARDGGRGPRPAGSCRGRPPFTGTGGGTRRRRPTTSTRWPGPVVRRIFGEAIEGGTIRAIAARLTAEGVPTPTGGDRWSPSTIHTILKQPMYTGEAACWRYGSEKIPGGGLRIFVRPEAEHIKLPAGTVPRWSGRQSSRPSPVACSATGSRPVATTGPPRSRCCAAATPAAATAARRSP